MSLVREFAFCMLFINLSFWLVNLTGLFPFETEIAGIKIYDELNKTVTDLQNRIEGSMQIVDYLTIGALMIVLGLKVIFSFFLMAFFGIGSLLDALGVPTTVSVLVSITTGAIILYELGRMLLARG